MSRGKVWLVGAGPGDAELLTLKAVRVIGAADVILVDDLVGDEVLLHARADARVVHVGKRGGCPSTPQAFIERLMIAEARAGHSVVRLKGGDPVIFGRSGEEIAALRAAHVECEVVNGITAGIAAASALGVPLTHRALCHGAIFVTAHAHAGAGPDWAALVATRMPLVIYMGVARCEELQRELLEAGLDGATPAAIVSNATRADERSIVTTVARLATTLREAAIRSPAVMIVGEVAREALLLRAPGVVEDHRSLQVGRFLA
jgi:uroporphyrin-III C-methyltransferase